MPHGFTRMRALTGSLLLGAVATGVVASSPLLAQGTAGPAFITSDLGNFYRAFDAARGQDSASRVKAFRDLYIKAGSRGLLDWTVMRLADVEALMPDLTRAGWQMPEMEQAFLAPDADSAHQRLMRVLTPLVADDGARRLAQFTARRSRYFEGIRARIQLLDTSTAFRAATLNGLRRLQALYPEAQLPPVYLVVGRLTSGGTATRNGMLIGVEMSTRTPTTPIHELTDTERSMISARSPEAFTALIVHEAVHTMQTPRSGGTLLSAVLLEGLADFMMHLALADSSALSNGYQKYGRANEARLKREFRQALARNDDASRWLYSWGRPDNYGAADLGYFMGFRICEAYYQRAKDKHAALERLLSGRDPEGILADSRYLETSGGRSGARPGSRGSGKGRRVSAR